jgi:hypothetical protein
LGESLEAATVGESGNVRVTGTFPYLSGMGCFVNYITLLAIITYLFSGTKRIQLLAIVAMVMGVVAGFMTGARSVVLFQGGMMVVALVASRYSGKVGTGLIRLFAGATILGLVIYYTAAGRAMEAFVQRLQTTGNTLESLQGPLTWILDAAEHAGAIGYGTGSTHQARPALESLLGLANRGLLPPELYEVEYPRICLELGPIGFLVIFTLRISVMAIPLRYYFTSGVPAHKGVALLCAASMFLQYSSPNVFNHVYSLYFWVMAGFPFALREWARVGRAQMPVAPPSRGRPLIRARWPNPTRPHPQRG